MRPGPELPQGESTDLNRGEIEQIAESFGEKGLRVLAFCPEVSGF